MTKPIVFDIETSPIVADVWGMWDQNVGLNQIRRDWRILSISWKELGAKRVHYRDAFTPEAEKDMLADFWQVMNDTDVLIGQNIRKYDVRKLNARFIAERMPPYAPVRIVDTLAMAKRVGMFTSNKLEYLAKYATATRKDAHRQFPGHSMWTEFEAGNPRARAAMRAYNKDDVLATESLYLALAPWDRAHLTVDKGAGCPRCGGSLRLTDQVHTSAAGARRHLLQCEACNGWSRGRLVGARSTGPKPISAT